MVQKKRTYKKRAYRRRYKRTYRRRGYKRRFYKPIKKPEIHIVEHGADEVPFGHASSGMGTFANLTPITSNSDADVDNLVYNIAGKPIEGKKIRLKYLYIKGFIRCAGGSGDEDVDDFNCKLMVFRWKRNTMNSELEWRKILTDINPDKSSPTNWTTLERYKMLYMKDWKNDIKINFYKKVKNLYRKYDDANNIIPFKIRIPLYDCVLTCDSFYSNALVYTAQVNPSTNGLYFTFLSDKYTNGYTISYKYKLYYTDY